MYKEELEAMAFCSYIIFGLLLLQIYLQLNKTPYLAFVVSGIFAVVIPMILWFEIISRYIYTDYTIKQQLKLSDSWNITLMSMVLYVTLLEIARKLYV